MAAGFQCNIIGLTDSASLPAASVVSPNLRVTTTLGPVATVGDVVAFPGPSSVAGNWVLPSLRCLVGRVPAINASSAGIAYTPLGVPSGPMRMSTPDARASGT
jgi:hypothetical protein